MSAVNTRAARLALIVELIEGGAIRSQTQLVERLAASGIEVSQPTLSKDLLAVGAVRVRDASGTPVYAIGDAEPQPVAWSKLAKVCADLLTSVASSGNVVILKTPPGAAQFFASALDRVGWSAVLGTIAGDDTIAVFAADPQGGQAIADRLRALSEGRMDD